MYTKQMDHFHKPRIFIPLPHRPLCLCIPSVKYFRKWHHVWFSYHSDRAERCVRDASVAAPELAPPVLPLVLLETLLLGISLAALRGTRCNGRVCPWYGREASQKLVGTQSALQLPLKSACAFVEKKREISYGTLCGLATTQGTLYGRPRKPPARAKCAEYLQRFL